MIHTQEDFGRHLSVSKLFKYLDKTNQDLVIIRREARTTSPMVTGQTHARQVSGTPAAVMSDRRIPTSVLRIVEEPSGSFGEIWNKSLTLEFKKFLLSRAPKGTSISVVRYGDLGIRSAKGAMALGVILEATYNLSTKIRVEQRTCRCYVLSYNRWLRIRNAMYEFKDCKCDLVFLTDRSGNYQPIKLC